MGLTPFEMLTLRRLGVVVSLHSAVATQDWSEIPDPFNSFLFQRQSLGQLLVATSVRPYDLSLRMGDDGEQTFRSFKDERR
jgi:hypothetical protein